MKGRRLPDTVEGSFPLDYDDLRPGDIWKVLDKDTGEPKVVTEHPSNLTGAAWKCIVPGFHNRKLFANLIAHTVREHADGSVSVRAGDGSSNSILVTRLPGEVWHGYIERNIWDEC